MSSQPQDPIQLVTVPLASIPSVLTLYISTLATVLITEVTMRSVSTSACHGQNYTSNFTPELIGTLFFLFVCFNF